MAKDKLFVIVGLVIVVAGLVVWGIKDAKQKSANRLVTYQSSDSNRPRLVIKERFRDIGQMKLQETRSTEFVLKNKGNRDLQIYYGTTNCGCTFGQVIAPGRKSPVFGMHTNQSFFISIKPGEEFAVKAIYKPFLMPVSGPVQRAVSIKTNDPDNRRVEFVIAANVL